MSGAKDRPAIVVVDDDRGIRDLIAESFDSDDYEVVGAVSAEKALPLIQEKKPALILLDVRLPGIDGIEALRRIKKMDKGLVVVMITAFGDEKSAMRCMKLGAAAYVHKPFDVNYVTMLAQNYLP